MTPEIVERRHARSDYPAWVREVDLNLPVKPQFLVTGNLRDVHQLPADDPRDPFPGTVEVLLDVLVSSGYDIVLRFDPIDGLQLLYETQMGTAASVHRSVHAGDPTPITIELLRDVITKVVSHEKHRVALMLDYASRMRADDQQPSPELLALLAAAEKLAYTSRTGRGNGARRAPLYNTLLWMVDRELDLPHWLAAIDAVRVVSVPLPSLGVRLATANLLASSLPGAAQAAPEQRTKAVRTFAASTDGMTTREMLEVMAIASDSGVPYDRVDEAVRSLRVGLLDNPWRQVALRDRIRAASDGLHADQPTGLSARVLGQPKAVRKALDILIRAAMGLSGSQSGGHAGRPQGILFFAGPTGVGKTELAKALAEVLFGSEDAYVRFDMSEFSAEHSEARLIGAPPGYVGHDAGGELTNAVRQRPFSILLFDEIDKAHPQILDKFLQILEDGRLTDGGGSTVYFSETVIIFTSNLGVYTQNEQGERVAVIQPGEPYEELERKLRAAITKHFTEGLGRPELLNRIGDNIVVFDYISESVGRRLIARYIGNVLERVQSDLGVEVSAGPEIIDRLEGMALAGLPFGGRGLGAQIETSLVNPLARALFELPPGTAAARITEVVEEPDGWRIGLE